MRRLVIACALAVVTVAMGPAAAAPSGERDRVHLFGSLSVDGAPLDAEFLGAVVLRANLVAPCQVTIPTVASGKYDIEVFAKKETAGCGARGARIALWTYVGETQVYTVETFRWPGNGTTARFDASFATATSNGGVPTLTVFSGEVRERDGSEVASGTRVDAYIGEERCGVGSVRRGADFNGYIVAVVGPDATPGCKLGAPIEFRIDGRPASETATNGRELDDALDLTVR